MKHAATRLFILKGMCRKDYSHHIAALYLLVGAVQCNVRICAIALNQSTYVAWCIPEAVYYMGHVCS